MQVQSGYLEINGARLYYEESGAGDAVVLLHGFSLDARAWDGQFDLLSRRYRSVRYDLRGFGRSSMPRGAPYTHAGDLDELLARLATEKPVLVGLSFGGGLAIDFALTYPKTVRALVLVDPILGGFRWSDQESNHYRAVVRRAKENGIEAARQHWMRDPMFATTMARPDVAAAFAEFVAGYSGWHWLNEDPQRHLDPPAIQRLGDIRVPTLVVVGELDVPDIQGITDTLVQGIPGATKAVVQGAGHLSSMEAPGAVNTLVMEFVEGLS
jgi:3-oxoadipate enol-lactonase